MISLRIDTAGSRITGFDCTGHSGSAAAGADVVCAAVTSAVRLTECALNDIVRAEAAVTVEEEAPRIALRLPESCGEETDRVCQVILSAFAHYLAQLSGEYPAHIRIQHRRTPPDNR